MALKTSEKQMFETQLIFDGSIKKEDEETFIELEEEEIDISKLASSLIKPKEQATLKPISERPVLHSYTENTGAIINVKRKNPDLQPASLS